jgi:Holliday junction resolvase RusA-like endonuclease
MIAFFVPGKPQPAGSKRAFRNPHTGHINVVDANKNAGAYKQQVAEAALAMYRGPLLTVPLQMQIDFYVQRPKSHYRTGGNAHLLRDSAPRVPTTKPDLLKLARGIEDALTGVVYVDDSLIAYEVLSKSYATEGFPPGAYVAVGAFTQVRERVAA